MKSVNPLQSKPTFGHLLVESEQSYGLKHTKQKMQYRKFNLISFLISELEQMRLTDSAGTKKDSTLDSAYDTLFQNLDPNNSVPMTKNQILKHFESNLDVKQDRKKHRY